MKVTFLGTGSAYRTPTIGGHWGKCNPANPKNKRLCQSVLLEASGYKILVDAGPDIRYQTIKYGVKDIDAVIITHAHYDHFFGLPELEVFSLLYKKTIPVYAHPETWQGIERPICWLLQGSKEHPATIEKNAIEYNNSLHLGETEILCFEQSHGSINSTGLRINDFAYCTDLNAISDDGWKKLEGIKTWVLECDSIEPSFQHNNLKQALEWIERLKPEKTYLTHIHPFVDHDFLTAHLPENVFVAYDGMTLEIES